MPVRTTVLRNEDGVLLRRVETLTIDNMVTAAHLELLTPRSDGCLQFSDVKLATRIFITEVEASRAAGPQEG